MPTACVRCEPHTDEGAATTPKYLLEVNYTRDGVRGIVAQGGSARKAAAQAAAKGVGGKLDFFYFAFGGTDVFTIADLPDNAAAAALALAVTAEGLFAGPGATPKHRAAGRRARRQREVRARGLAARWPSCWL